MLSYKMSDIQVEQILHMNEGEGDYSYANNSLVQTTAILKAKPLIHESVVELYYKYFPECFQFADLGCCSSSSAYMPAWEVIDVLHSTSQRLNHKPPMLQVFLNDLAGNDFNSTLKLWPSFYGRVKKEKGDEFGQCFLAAVPGSFYGRLFPPQSLHFIFSSYSLHWLSQVPKGLVSETGIPLNKKDVYVAKTCRPHNVHKAYLDQFESDFTSFLKFRSQELKPGGRMVLTLMGNDQFHPNPWELIGMVINDMVSEGMVEESKLESFNFPYYAPCAEEVREIIQRERSFNIHRLETFHLSWLLGFENDNKKLELDKYARGKPLAKRTRAVGEALLANHFGNVIMDDLFQRLSIKATELLEMGLGAYTNVLISLIKK